MLVTTAAMAVPAKRGLWSTITLSDGTQVRVELRGDEHLHYLQATDGTCYVKNNGVYERLLLKHCLHFLPTMPRR